MSFGFGLGDFITTGDKALMIYRKCTGAFSDHAGLAQQVDILRSVLLSVQDFASHESMPADRARVTALVKAREVCESTLDEVEHFLNKFSGFKSSKKRLIDVAKFVFKDVETLKQKLSHSTNILQLSLTSLTSLSVINLQKALETILKEHREGTRQPSVLSHAILDSQPAEEDELLDQLRYDLEDKDIHPDSIALNEQTIVSWLSTVTLEVERGEALHTQAVKLEFGEYAASEYLIPPEADKLLDTTISKVRMPAHGDDAGLMPLSTKIDPKYDFGVMEVKRPNSASSHRSMPESWHPDNHPNPDYVFSMLNPFFEDDPSIRLNVEENTHRVLRAFHQQDWQNRGYLTRGEVLQLTSAQLGQSSDILQTMIRQYDSQKNGRLTKSNFVDFMHDVIRTQPACPEEEIESLLLQLGHDYQYSRDTCADFLSKELFHATYDYLPEEAFDSEFLFVSKDNILPWGWSFKEMPGKPTLFFDRIREISFHSRTTLRLSGVSFTALALEADRCVEIISNFQNQWLGRAPFPQRSRYLRRLDEMREIALNFTLFENPTRLNESSDVDAIAACLEILNSGEGHKVLMEHTDLLNYLRNIHTLSRELCQLIEGFCNLLLGTFGAPRGEVTGDNFKEFQTKWRQKTIFTYANFIQSKSAETWPSIFQFISKARENRVLESIEPLAIQNARSQIKRKQEKFYLWPGVISHIRFVIPRSILGEEVKNVSILIHIDHSEGLYIDSFSKMTAFARKVHVPVDSAEFCSFEVRSSDLIPGSEMEILPDSKIDISIFSHPGEEIAKTNDISRTLCSTSIPVTALREIWNFEPNKVSLDFNTKGNGKFEATIEEPFRVTLRITMSHDFFSQNEEYFGQEAFTWLELLEKSPCYWGVSGDDLCAPGWEMKADADRVAYYENRATKGISWTLPC